MPAVLNRSSWEWVASQHRGRHAGLRFSGHRRLLVGSGVSSRAIPRKEGRCRAGICRMSPEGRPKARGLRGRCAGRRKGLRGEAGPCQPSTARRICRNDATAADAAVILGKRRLRVHGGAGLTGGCDRDTRGRKAGAYYARALIQSDREPVPGSRVDPAGFADPEVVLCRGVDTDLGLAVRRNRLPKAGGRLVIGRITNLLDGLRATDPSRPVGTLCHPSWTRTFGTALSAGTIRPSSSTSATRKPRPVS
ncbi:hypothetical protein SAMN05421539_10389 [Jannaschia seohaensis]|uniref:Uncharacterized protein n=1 Tax=Jannaschia seohaensis TaxID=475081 RepID=A0A2Y9APM1_9RHOB|nr:hypothetical protein BCF38_10389 [Jannaschia seohaensis]SSA44289.1 hypothetical protein SAMN05421539_10389 [Jannaschia seohaensis]